MDNYPEHLAPELDENSGCPITPFDEWWPSVKTEFSNIPDEIAKEWLYRHWGRSPYSWLRSDLYDFNIEEFPSNQLTLLLNRIYRFEVESEKLREKGMYLCGEHPEWKWRPRELIWLVKFMNKNRVFPSPIIVLDNRDGHLAIMPDTIVHSSRIPKGMVLIEGHLRHEIGTYLQSIGRLADKVMVCMLRRKL